MKDEDLTGLQRRAAAFFQDLQRRIIAGLEAFDPTTRFRLDRWERPGGGGGDTCVIEGGALLEKGGVNFSEVHGELPADFAAKLPGTGTGFWAAGVSLVLHPQNPYVPTVHANFRMIRQGDKAWFGGGADLTPYYPFEEDARHFHRTLKAACDAHHPDFYPRFKAQCDDYFYLPHRKEARGLGGIFYDHLTGDAHGMDLEQVFAFAQTAGNAFLPAYAPIVQRRQGLDFGERERGWQAIRRGRYVEFNLMYDKGTLFGLRTSGRIESILMSLPPIVRYVYDHQPDGPEAKLLEALVPRDWAAE
ncbi:MAG: oxygen-dependent coproporphyrinogen oxidase [Myxococcales bacterium]|nr:oxygen-dependent coproporphyrinogen oxidase [Myxococcales bacterium]